MLTTKILAAVGIAGALLIGATPDASANPWRGPHFRTAPAFRGPVYRAPIFRAPTYGPVYQTPVYGPTYGPVYQTPVYGPVYRPGHIGWRHPWSHGYGRRW